MCFLLCIHQHDPPSLGSPMSLSYRHSAQDQLAAARAAVAAGDSRLAEEQESRRQFLVQFQAKSKAALAERVALEEQVRGSGSPTAIADITGNKSWAGCD